MDNKDECSRRSGEGLSELATLQTWTWIRLIDEANRLGSFAVELRTPIRLLLRFLAIFTPPP